LRECGLNKRNTFLVWVLSVAVFFIAGCTSVPVKKQLTFNALVLENNTGTQLENVRIAARKNGAFASCGVILRRTSCSTTFQTKVYQGNSVYISWLHNGHEQLVGPLYVEPPEKINYDLPASIVISFNSDNDVTAKFMY